MTTATAQELAAMMAAFIEGTIDDQARRELADALEELGQSEAACLVRVDAVQRYANDGGSSEYVVRVYQKKLAMNAAARCRHSGRSLAFFMRDSVRCSEK